MIINFYAQLLAAGLPVISADDETASAIWSRSLTQAEQVVYADIIYPPTYAQLREREYDKVGATDRARLDALWEMMIENRPEAAQALQAERLKIKDKYPKQTAP